LPVFACVCACVLTAAVNVLLVLFAGFINFPSCSFQLSSYWFQ
jgi:hypothetical protein